MDLEARVSKEQVRSDVREFIKAKGAVVPLGEMLMEFRWFQPRPKLRIAPDDPEAEAKTFAAKVRLLKTLLHSVEKALLEGRLTAEPSAFSAIPLDGEGGVLEAWTGVKATNKGIKMPRLRTYQNHHLRIDGDDFLRFIGGVDGVRGDLGSAYGGPKPSAQASSTGSTFPTLVEAAVRRHLAGSTSKAIKEFMQEYEALKRSRRKGGRGKKQVA